MSGQDSNFTTTIGVFSHQFQGPFSGDLVNQIRQSCVLRNIRFIGFCTGAMGDYDLELNIDQLDGAIIVRNSISNDLAKNLLQRGAALVSISYDYFPLDIPVIDSNNIKSIDLIFSYLEERGHTTISFVGNLKNYDVRKRYERYTEQMSNNQFNFDENLLIQVNTSELGDGFNAGAEFIRRGCNATAVITESSDISVGFISALREAHIDLSDQLEVVGYGATPLMPILCPEITTVDQNIHLMACQAVSVICEILAGNVIKKDSLIIDPKLIKNESVDYINDSPYLASSVDIAELYEPNYMAGLISSHSHWCTDICDSDLDNLMSIAPVFEKYMKEATLSRILVDDDGTHKCSVLKHFTVSKTLNLDPSGSENTCQSKYFPPTKFSAFRNHFLVVNHFFISSGSGSTPHAVLSLYGDAKSLSACSSYPFFAGQMETIVRLQSLQIENVIVKKSNEYIESNQAKNKPELSLFPVTWNLTKQITEWSKEALSLIDLTTSLDINIYRNMEITDRIHQDDIDYIRSLLATCATTGENFCTNIRIKNKSGEFLAIAFQAEAKKENGEVVELTFNIGILNQAKDGFYT